MKYSYKIIYDIDKDIWNWYYGVNYSNNSNDLAIKEDKQMANKILGIKTLEQADPILRKFIENKKDETGNFMKIANSEFLEKFTEACMLLEKITNRPIATYDLTFYVTTFPRMVVFYDEGIIFMHAKIDEELWGMPIDGFLHEGLHFQFES